MRIPYVIDNETHRLADVLNEVLAGHAERITVARRLPVRLLLPLALLILPGFVVLAVGPAVLQALARLAPMP